MLPKRSQSDTKILYSVFVEKPFHFILCKCLRSSHCNANGLNKYNSIEENLMNIVPFEAWQLYTVIS